MPQRKTIERTKSVTVRISVQTREWSTGEHTVDVPEHYTEAEVAKFVREQIDDEAIDVWNVCKWCDSETVGYEISMEESK